MPDTVLILNPGSGGGAGDSLRRRLREHAAALGWTVRETAAAGDASALARRAALEGAATVVAAGGDGTVGEVIDGLADAWDRVRLGIVPLGTANDLARTLEIPLVVDDAVAVVDHGIERRVDLLQAIGPGGRRVLGNAATGGISVVVQERLDPATKASWGPLAYLRAAVEVVPELPRHALRITVDGEVLLLEARAVLVANGRSAGGVAFATEASPDDRRLDLLVITAEDLVAELGLAARWLVGRHLGSGDLVQRRAKRIRIEAEPPMPFTGDGESLGTTPLEFSVLPGALRVLVPTRVEAPQRRAS